MTLFWRNNDVIITPCVQGAWVINFRLTENYNKLLLFHAYYNNCDKLIEAERHIYA